MDELGVAIVGCGWVAEEHLKAFQNDPRATIRVLVSRSAEKAERFRQRYNLSCSVETDFNNVLPMDDVHIVVICTPHHVHTKYVITAAEAGKHVLVEKPAAKTLEELHNQQAVVRSSGVKSLVSFVLRHNPLLKTVKSLIGEGVFGHIFMMEVDYIHRIWWTPEQKWIASLDKSGTALLTAGCHAIDTLRWFAGKEIEEVSAFQVQTENPIEYPGTISVNVKFTDGMIGRSLTSFDTNMPYRFRIGVYGTEGAMLDNRLYAPRLFPGQNNFSTVPCVLPDSGDVAHHPFTDQARYFIDCIVEDKRPLPDLDDALLTHEICFAADRSAQENRSVKLSELR